MIFGSLEENIPSWKFSLAEYCSLKKNSLQKVLWKIAWNKNPCS